MAEQTDTDLEQALAADRDHLRQWRSTPEGEADYQAAVDRAKQAAQQLRAIS